MIKYFCDRCNFQIPVDKDGKPTDESKESVSFPGVITGPKMLCGACWATWRGIIQGFLQKQGQ